MEDLALTKIGDDQDKLDTFITKTDDDKEKLDTFITDVKKILKDSDLVEKIIDRGFNAWLSETLKSEFDIPKLLTRQVIAPIFSAIAISIKKKTENQVAEKASKIAKFFRSSVNKILGMPWIYGGLIKVIKSIQSTNKKPSPVNLETLSTELGEFREWLQDNGLKTSLDLALLRRDIGRHPPLLKGFDEGKDESDFKLDEIDWIKPGSSNGIPYVPSSKLLETLKTLPSSTKPSVPLWW